VISEDELNKVRKDATL